MRRDDVPLTGKTEDSSYHLEVGSPPRRSRAMIVRLLAAGLMLALAAPAFAQGNPPAPAQPQEQQQEQQQQQEPDRPPSFEEQVVVSASRAEQQLVNAPAAVSLISAET